MDIETTGDVIDRRKQALTNQKTRSSYRTALQNSQIRSRKHTFDRLRKLEQYEHDRDRHANRATQTSHGETYRHTSGGTNMQTIDSYANKLTSRWRGRLETRTKPSKNTSIDKAKELT